jgi:hypothetical protein
MTSHKMQRSTGKKFPPGLSPFLQLPGEIRNKIYELVIPRSHVLVIPSHPQKEWQALQEKEPWKKHHRPLYRLSGQILSIDDQSSDPIGLLQSCRKVYQEAMPVFYSKTTPCFDHIKSVHKFLNRVPPAGLCNIRSLRLEISEYGEPRLTKDRRWKSKQTERWTTTCERIVRSLTSLECLELDLRLATWPMTLSPDAKWTAPLMILRGDGLHLVRLTLRHHMFNETRLGMVARRIEDRMMTETGREERDVREALQAINEMEEQARQKAASPPRAKKVLVIKQHVTEQKTLGFNEPAKLSKSTKPVPKTYYRTQGLAGFDRIDLDTAGVCFVDCK